MVSVDLVAGRHTPVGTVNVSVVGTEVHVSYALDEGYLLAETHLAVAARLSDIPQTRKGNPIPGQFPYKASHRPAVAQFDCAIGSYPAGATLVIAAQAELAGGGSAWAAGADFPGANWATYFTCTLPAEGLDITGTWTYSAAFGKAIFTLTETAFYWAANGAMSGEGEVVSYDPSARVAVVHHTDHPDGSYQNRYSKLTWSSASSQPGASQIYLASYMPRDTPQEALAETSVLVDLGYPALATKQFIEIAGTWSSSAPRFVATITDQAMEFYDPSLSAQFFGYDNDQDYFLVFWNAHPVQTLNGRYSKVVWSDLKENEATMQETDGFGTIEEALQATTFPWTVTITRGVTVEPPPPPPPPPPAGNGDISLFGPQSYLPIVAGAVWQYNCGAAQVTAVDTAQNTFTISNIGSSGSLQGYAGRNEFGNFVAFSSFSGPSFLPVHDYFGFHPMMYEDARIGVGLTWQDQGNSNGYPVINTCTVTSTSAQVTTPGGLTFGDCLVLQRVITYPDGYDWPVYLEEVTYYVQRGVGFVEEIRKWSDPAREPEINYVVSYSIPSP